MTSLDHLVYAVPDLDSAVRDFSELTGIVPVMGGPHVGVGTRNALVGLGGGAYLELIGPDPQQPPPAAPRPFGIDGLVHPALRGWGLRTDDLDAAIAAARAAGYDPGDVWPFRRRVPGGTLLEWRISRQHPLREVSLAPFLIDWGGSPHPSATLPAGLTLQELTLGHPQPVQVRGVCAALGGADVPVVASPRPVLVARLAMGESQLLLT